MRKPRVLVAEDHADVAKAMCRVLTLDCDIVGIVSDGRAAIEAAERLRPDLIVLDLNLPEIHGLEACHQITRVNPDVKVIVFTAMNDPEIRQRSFEVGAAAFVPKTACNGGGDLLSTVRRLWGDGSRSDRLAPAS